MIDAAFWASLRREEGYMPRISLAFLSPEQAVHPLVFEALTAASRPYSRAWRRRSNGPGSIWASGATEELYVWGTTRTIPKLCFVLEVAAPGLLVVKHHTGEEAGKFVNFAVLEGDQIKIVDERAKRAGLPRAAHIPDSASLARHVGTALQISWCNWPSPCVRMGAVEFSGGSGGQESWRESIVQPISYSVSPLFCDSLN